MIDSIFKRTKGAHMPNSTSARDAIKAEIAHFTEGLVYYQQQIDKLQKALAVLGDTGANKKAAPTKTAITTKPARGKAKTKGRATAAPGKIPSTGGDFWISLISDRPQSGSDVLSAAIAKLGLQSSRETKATLSARMTNALTHLVKSKQIQDSGVRRERRFFR